jgi:glycosyltransferase involved in cell wall biosynthesis
MENDRIIKKTNSNLPLVSIGLPVVKSNFLKKAISCCLKQTYSNVEIIILNNALTKEIGDEIENVVFLFNDRKIRYFRNEKQLPIVDNWNRVLELSSGYYFSILCDDDFWEDEYIETMISLSLKYPTVEIFHSRVTIVDHQENIVRLASNFPEFEDVFDFVYNRLAKGREQFLSDFLVKTEAIKSKGGFVSIPQAWGSDDLTWFLIAQENGIVGSNRPLYYYRNSELTVTYSISVKKKIEFLHIHVAKLKEFIENIIPNSAEQEIKKRMVLKAFNPYLLQREKDLYDEMRKKNRWFSFLGFLYKLKLYFLSKKL